MNDVMTVREVAEILRIHPRIVSDKARDGEIPAFKIGNRWRFHRKDIDEYMKPRNKRGRKRK